jgi:hypothetical protein
MFKNLVNKAKQVAVNTKDTVVAIKNHEGCMQVLKAGAAGIAVGVGMTMLIMK